MLIKTKYHEHRHKKLLRFLDRILLKELQNTSSFPEMPTI